MLRMSLDWVTIYVLNLETNLLSEAFDIIIDEISMVSKLLVYYIHPRLIQVFGCSHIVFGDFY